MMKYYCDKSQLYEYVVVNLNYNETENNAVILNQRIFFLFSNLCRNEMLIN